MGPVTASLDGSAKTASGSLRALWPLDEAHQRLQLAFHLLLVPREHGAHSLVRVGRR